MTSDKIRRALVERADPEVAATNQRFFKTGPGEYGEGDRFIGIRMPVLRRMVRDHTDTPLSEIRKLLRTGEHEVRSFALLILVRKFEKGTPEDRKRIFDFYLGHTKWINNWDLVDISASQIVGGHLFGHRIGILTTLARSDSLWERRIAIIATWYFIRQGQFAPTLRIARILLNDDHDLIHKAVGWMLREVGNRSIDVERQFLDRHYARMPRTMLRYAIERFDDDERRQYMAR